MVSHVAIIGCRQLEKDRHLRSRIEFEISELGHASFPTRSDSILQLRRLDRLKTKIPFVLCLEDEQDAAQSEDFLDIVSGLYPDAMKLKARSENAPLILRHLPDSFTLGEQAQLRSGLLFELTKFVYQNIADDTLNVDSIKSALPGQMAAIKAQLSAALNMGPAHFIKFLRMREAARLLTQSSEPIINIHLSVGINDGTVFDRLFKSRYGMAPTKYRESNRISGMKH